MQQNKSNIIHLCKTVQCLFILLKQHLAVPPCAAIAVCNKMLPITGDQSFSALGWNLSPFIFAELHGYVCVCVCVALLYSTAITELLITPFSYIRKIISATLQNIFLQVKHEKKSLNVESMIDSLLSQHLHSPLPL